MHKKKWTTIKAFTVLYKELKSEDYLKKPSGCDLKMKDEFLKRGPKL